MKCTGAKNEGKEFKKNQKKRRHFVRLRPIPASANFDSANFDFVQFDFSQLAEVKLAEVELAEVELAEVEHPRGADVGLLATKCGAGRPGVNLPATPALPRSPGALTAVSARGLKKWALNVHADGARMWRHNRHEPFTAVPPVDPTVSGKCWNLSLQPCR